MPVVLYGTECPLAPYGARLVELAKEYASKGVVIWGIDANEQDSITEIAAFARRHQIEFPILKDVGNVVADRLGATRTPEALLLDRERRIVYRGRIDDQYGVGYSRPKPTARELSDALDDLVANKPVRKSTAPLSGCLIGRVAKRTAEATGASHTPIRRALLQKRCVHCHRPARRAFALTEYTKSPAGRRPCSSVENQRMPPWHANPARHILHDAAVSIDNNSTIAKADCRRRPERIAGPIAYTTGWQIPKPDLARPRGILCRRRAP